MSLQNPPMPARRDHVNPDATTEIRSSDPLSTTAASAPANLTVNAAGQPRPPERVRGWAEPNDTPIVDAARVSIRTFHRNKPAWSATLMFLWLRVLRPFLLIGSWALMAIYAFHHFIVPTERRDDVRLLALYAAIVLIILLVMLLVAPLRWRLQKDEDDAGSLPPPSTVNELADHARVPSRRLTHWRRVRRVVAHHDKHGNLSHAEPAEQSRVPLADHRASHHANDHQVEAPIEPVRPDTQSAISGIPAGPILQSGGA